MIVLILDVHMSPIQLIFQFNNSLDNHPSSIINIIFLIYLLYIIQHMWTRPYLIGLVHWSWDCDQSISPLADTLGLGLWPVYVSFGWCTGAGTETSLYLLWLVNWGWDCDQSISPLAGALGLQLWPVYISFDWCTGDGTVTSLCNTVIWVNTHNANVIIFKVVLSFLFNFTFSVPKF